MSFTNPQALVLFLSIPVILYLGWPRQRFRRVRDSFSLLLRLAIILLVVLAISGTQVVRTADRLAVVFLMDVSDSIDTTMREAGETYVREAMQNMGVDDESAIILFGANALVERPLSRVRELASIQSTPDANNTDLAEAIRLGLALLPNDAARRMVIVSDGRPTVGDTSAAAELAAATGVEINYVGLSREATPEVQVTDVRVPSSINAGQEFDLNMVVESEETTAATITVLASGEIIHRQDVNLRPGSNNYTLALEGGGSGFKDFRVQVDPISNDAFYQNNQLSAFSQVIGSPRALVIHNADEDVQHLIPALEESGLTVDVTRPNSLPIGLASLAQYSSVVIVNVPATALSPQRMETFERYVRDLGGGLVMVGGPETYGAGGYFQTPLEDALPVEMRLRDQQRLPQLTLAFVIDRSGSMGSRSPSGIPHIELAKEAMIRSVDFLQGTDRAGVVSFDTQGFWIADIQPVRDRLDLQRLIASLRSGGGTDILAGMNLVADALRTDPSARKHIILLTDGGANSSGLVELTKDLLVEYDVTTSVVAIGGGSAPFLEEMAKAGDGNYHIITDADNIPTVFTLETVLATRSYITEEQFFPSLAANHAIMDGIESSPPLYGYVATTPKQTAQTVLRGPEPFSDPVLAAWQYGLGRSVAFTSDASARWGTDWVGWEGFSRFWNQAVRWTITEGSNNLETRVVLEGEQARLVVDARDGDGNFLNGLNLQTSLVDPEIEVANLPLRQVAPGRYEATFTPDVEGAYFLRVTGNGIMGGEEIDVNQTTGWVFSYSPEYNIGDGAADVNLLGDLAALTGGRSLADSPELAFNHNLEARNAVTPIWPWLLIAAATLLPFDVAVRRLIITRRDWQRARQAVFGRASVAAQSPSERFSTLLSAKERAQERSERQAESVSTISALRKQRSDARQEAADSAAGAPKPDAKPNTPAPAARKPRKAPKPGGNIAGELLKRRKNVEED